MASWDSWLARDLHSRSDRSSKAVPVDKGAGGAEEARLCEPVAQRRGRQAETDRMIVDRFVEALEVLNFNLNLNVEP